MFVIPKKEWWRTSRFQSQATESVRGSSTLQNGNYQGSITNDQTERLSCIHRFIRCFPSYRTSPRLAALLTFPMEGSSLSVPYDCLRFVFQSLCLHESFQAHFGTLTLSRHQDFCVLGRLALIGGQQAIGYSTSANGGISSPRSRLAHQHQEIGIGSHPTTGTSRLLIEYQDDDSSFAVEKTSGHQTFDHV